MCPKLSATFLCGSPVDGVAQLPKRWFSVLSHDLSMEFRRKKVIKLGEEIVTLVSIQRWSLASGVNGHLDFSPALL